MFTSCFAWMTVRDDADYTLHVGEHRFGFVDRSYEGFEITWSDSCVELGPLGSYLIPVSAGVAWGLLLAALMIVVAVAAMLAGRKRKV